MMFVIQIITIAAFFVTEPQSARALLHGLRSTPQRSEVPVIGRSVPSFPSAHFSPDIMKFFAVDPKLGAAPPTLERLNVTSARSCDNACGSDDACKSVCVDLENQLCGNTCDAVCGEANPHSESCTEHCESMQASICPEGTTLSETPLQECDFHEVETELRPGISEDTPEPVEPNSPLFPKAMVAWRRSLDAINAQRHDLGLTAVSQNSSELLHAWVKLEHDEGFKLCTRMKVDGESEYITIDISGDMVTSVYPTQVVFGSNFTYQTSQALEQSGSGTSLDSDSATLATFPCSPAFTKLLSVSRSRLGLAHGTGFSAGLAGRAYNGDSSTPLPVSYSARAAFPMCFSASRDQGECGACYAFAAAELAQTRLCIARQKQMTSSAANGTRKLLLTHRDTDRRMYNHSELTPQEIVSCGSADRPELRKPYCTLGPGGTKSLKYSNGCNGGGTFDALFYVHMYGLPTQDCVPYVSGGGTFMDHFRDFVNLLVGKVPLCSALEARACHAGRAQHKLYRPEVIASGDVSSIQRAIYEGGTVYASLSVYEDFMYKYKADEVYVRGPDAGAYLGGHAVMLDGWGTENGIPYWRGQNSWGEAWGRGGLFKIRRGSNEVGIEDGVHFARAAVDGEVRPSAGSDCVAVEQDGSSCRLVNNCSGEVRKVRVSYLGSEENCGSWMTTIPELFPGSSRQHSIQNAHLCTVVKDSFVSKFDDTLYYQDMTAQYAGYSCVLRNTYTGRGTRKRWCGDSFVTLRAGGVASMPASMCADGCREISGQAVHETTN